MIVISLLSTEGQRDVKFDQKYPNCVPKMNDGLTGLERHERE